MRITCDRPLLINILSTIFLLINSIYDYIVNSGINLFRIGLMAITLWGVYFIYNKTFLSKSKISFYLIYGFIVMAMYGGSVLGFYTIIPMYDKILHLASGVIIAIIGYILFLYLNRGDKKEVINPYMGIVFSILVSISAAAVWEIWEFSTDQLFGFMSQNNSLVDTMMDIICGTIMGIIANIPIYLNIKGKKIKFIQKIVDEMKC